jgi:hypothetical protein
MSPSRGSTPRQDRLTVSRNVTLTWEMREREIWNQTSVEAGSKITVTLRVVGGDEKGSLKSETLKYGRESQGTRIQERLRWQGPEA